MGVGCLYPSALQAFNSGFDSFSSSKEVAVNLVPSGVDAKYFGPFELVLAVCIQT